MTPIENPKSKIENPRSLVCGGSTAPWRWDERIPEVRYTNGVEAWVFALCGEYKVWRAFEAADFDRYDLIILNMNPEALTRYTGLLQGARKRRATVVALYEGELAFLHKRWRAWKAMADLCDLVIAINVHGVGLLRAITSSPVSYVGIPYPVDLVKESRVPFQERQREILLCSALLSRPLDYMASRPLGLPMYGYEVTVSRRFQEVLKHRTLSKHHYVGRAIGEYGDPSLTVYPQTHIAGFFQRAASSLLWMNLDPRYTWGRYVLDAAALGVPIVTTRETGHAPQLFPDLVVDTPYDVEGATRIARRLIDDRDFYAHVVDHASAQLDWYKPEATAARLWDALGKSGG